mgnify:CR=1 FL=1
MHIPQDELQKFQDGTMNTDEMIHFLEHMEQCDFCLDELLQNEDAASEYAPSYLQDEILKKAASPEVQASRKIHETAYWMKLLCAGLRTAVGMGVALIMLFLYRRQILRLFILHRKQKLRFLHPLTLVPA